MKKNLLLLALLGTGLMLSGIGCGTTDSASSAPAKEEAKTAIPIPADSPFAKIQLGMGMSEVYALIGRPTDTGNHITGKAFIPYYYGGDTHRSEAIYKGLGRVVFSPRHAFTQDMEVIEINYNPSEK